MLVLFALIIIGFLFLIKGADLLVKGASALARKHNISDLVIGLTIVAFGTSAPELVVNIIASLQEQHAIVFGNVIGSNNFNLFIILGITGIITPLVVQSSTVWKEIPISLFSIIVFYILANDWLFNQTVISRVDGAILLFLFVLFLIYVFRQLKNNIEIKDNQSTFAYSNKKITIYMILGLGGLIIGGNFIVTNAVKLATLFGISEKIVGLTIVAAGTSLPELATSVVAAIKRNNDIAVGNIIGSNLFNIFLILGVSSLIKPMEFDRTFNNEIYLLTIGTLLLFLAMFTGKNKKLDRWEAIILLLLYIGYSVYLLK